MSAKELARNWLPPTLYERLKPIVKRGVYFSGQYPDWEHAKAHATGYDSALILECVKRSALKVKNGEAAFERDSVAFAETQHSFPVLAALLRTATEDHGRLSVLDFGGSLGSSYFQCIHFVDVCRPLTWGVVEQAHFVNCGRECFESPQLRFFFTIAECMKTIVPNVALLSSVLQYLPSPYQVIEDLMAARIPFIVIDRTPFSALEEDRITVQHVPASIYPASYPCLVFGKQPFLKRIRKTYEVIAEFESADGAAIADGLKFAFGGVILRKI